MMVMAEHEAEQIAGRTKAALAARRERGLPLGAENPRCRNLGAEHMAAGRVAGAASQSRAADKAYGDILPDMVAWREEGDTLADIARRLNHDGHTTRRGCPWTAGTVHNVLRRA